MVWKVLNPVPTDKTIGPRSKYTRANKKDNAKCKWQTVTPGPWR